MTTEELRKSAYAIGFYGYLVRDNASALADLIDGGDKWKERAKNKADWVRDFIEQLDKYTNEMKTHLKQLTM